MQVNYVRIVPASAASEYDNSKLALSLASWLSIGYELQRVIEIAVRIEQLLTRERDDDALELESLTWHLVLRYGRCFDSNASGRSTALGVEMVRKLGVEDFTTLHDGLIHRRHNTFAHPGGDCSCRLSVHLMEQTKGPHLLVTLDEEAPSAIHDAEQAALIAKLCHALQGVVDSKVDKASTAHAASLEAKRDEIVQRLRDNEGKHANPSQQAVSILARLPNW